MWLCVPEANLRRAEGIVPLASLDALTTTR